MTIRYSIFSIGFTMVIGEEIRPGEVIIVVMSLLVGGYMFGIISPHLMSILKVIF